MFIDKSSISGHLILLGNVSVANMGSRAAKKDLDRRSCPNNFQRKVHIDKFTIEQIMG
jgi:hypothetical protein